MRAWLLGIVLTSLAGGLARQLAPQGREQAMVRLAAGLLLAAAILRPLAGQRWDAEALLPDMPDLRAGEQAAAYQKNQQDALSAIIAEKTQAYIWDKADRLGLRCTVEVTVSAGESGIPLPDTVTVRGSYSAALAAYIEEEVGVPPEKQIWLEEEAWQKRKESES